MACKCIHHSQWCANQSMKVSNYLQMLLAGWLAGWMAGLYKCINLQQGSCLAGGASCQLAAHARKTVPLHQYLPVSQAKGIKKY